MIESSQFIQPGSFLWRSTYRIERVLGHGGFGVTYLAMDMGLQKRVAIKEFFPSTLCVRDPESGRISASSVSATADVDYLKQKFIKEARNLAKLTHPNIIGVHTAFEENGTAYFVMEYVEGQNLQEIINMNGPISADIALVYVNKIGQALEYLHGRKMNHLDVKPANIMLNKAGNPILIDFGLSKQYDSKGQQTSTTPVGLSHGFAPMEQYSLEGIKGFSPTTDVYSLAATLYYLISGQVPPNSIEIVEGGLTFPERVPMEIRSAINKAMSPRRDHRHQSIGSFLQDLNHPAAHKAGDGGGPMVIMAEAEDSEEEATMIHQTASQAGAHSEHDTVLVGSNKPPVNPTSRKPASPKQTPAKSSGGKRKSGMSHNMIVAVSAVGFIIVFASFFWMFKTFQNSKQKALKKAKYDSIDAVLEQVHRDQMAEASKSTKESKALKASTSDIDYSNVLWGSPAISRKGYQCHFFDGNFYDDNGNPKPFKLVVLEKNGSFVKAVYKNMVYQSLPNFDMSVSVGSNNLYFSGNDGVGPFSLDVYWDDSKTYRGTGVVSGKSIPISLKPTTNTFNF